MKLRISLKSPGFTLVELLVVIAIVAIIASLLAPGLGRARQKARETNESGAARQLILAWQLYAEDNRDAVLPGYSSRYEAKDHQGKTLGSPIRDRYPWRIAPHLANNFRAIYVNDSRRFLEDAARRSPDDYVYRASLYPSLGYNSVYLGGDEQKFNPELAETTFGSEWLVRRGAQIQRPSEMLAFASARSRPGGDREEPGYFVVYPPRIVAPLWENSFSSERPPEKFGFVHPRWHRRAIAALTDGHVQSLGTAELADMRRWSNAADRPDWTVALR